VTVSIPPHETAQSVLTVLAGVPLHQAAASIRMDPADLSDAVEVYRAAGYAALQAQAQRAAGIRSACNSPTGALRSTSGPLP
jgi:hypothetical protein